MIVRLWRGPADLRGTHKALAGGVIIEHAYDMRWPLSCPIKTGRNEW